MFSNRDLKKLIIPLFLDQLLLIIVGIIANMMLSYAGKAAISGVSLVDMVNMLLIGVLMALATGGAVVVSQYIGRKEKENADLAASQLMTVTLLVSVGIMVLVLLFNRPLLKLLFGAVETDVMDAAILYFVLSSLSYPFLAIYNSSAALFRSMGISRIAMMGSIFMNVLSAAGNAIAIFALHSGIIGVAVSTLIARALAAVLMFVLTLNKKNQVHVRFSEMFMIDGAMARRILNIAVPNGIENGLTQFGRVLLVSMTAMFGTTQIMANGITNSLVMVAVSFATAMNLAIVTVVGQCVGAGAYEEAISYTKRLIRLTYVGTLVVNVLLLAALPWLLSLYAVPQEVRDLAFLLLVIHAAFCVVLWPLSFTLSYALRAAGDAKYTMGVSIVTMFVFRVTVAYILGITLGMGVLGIWIAMGVDWIFRAIFYVTRFVRGKWRQLRVI